MIYIKKQINKEIVKSSLFLNSYNNNTTNTITLMTMINQSTNQALFRTHGRSMVKTDKQ